MPQRNPDTGEFIGPEFHMGQTVHDLCPRTRLENYYRGTGRVVTPTQDHQTHVIPAEGPSMPALRVSASLARVVSLEMRDRMRKQLVSSGTVS